MRIPRVLIILIVVLVVLQGASCGVAALRMPEGTSPEGIPDVLQDIGPEPPPVDLADVTACASISAAGDLAFAGPCRVVVAAASGSVRRLTIERVTGAIAMSLSADPDRTRQLDTEDVNVPPDEQVEIDLVCASPLCSVRLGD
jgi:hypothetical protein